MQINSNKSKKKWNKNNTKNVFDSIWLVEKSLPHDRIHNTQFTTKQKKKHYAFSRYQFEYEWRHTEEKMFPFIFIHIQIILFTSDSHWASTIVEYWLHVYVCDYSLRLRAKSKRLIIVTSFDIKRYQSRVAFPFKLWVFF